MNKEILRTFYESVAERNLEYVKNFFNEYKQQVKPNFVSVAINAAGTFGRDDIVSFILSENKYVHVIDMHIMNSVNVYHLETFKILVKYNKDNNKSYDYFEVLEDSCKKGHLHFVEYLIDNKLVDIHKNNEQALCIACKNGN